MIYSTTFRHQTLDCATSEVSLPWPLPGDSSQLDVPCALALNLKHVCINIASMNIDMYKKPIRDENAPCSCFRPDPARRLSPVLTQLLRPVWFLRRTGAISARPKMHNSEYRPLYLSTSCNCALVYFVCVRLESGGIFFSHVSDTRVVVHKKTQTTPILLA